MTECVKRRVLVAENHGLVGEVLERLLRHQKDMTCCGRVVSIAEVIPALETHKPEVLILELFLKDGVTTGILPQLTAQFPDVRAVIFSDLVDLTHVEGALNAGARGYITKQETSRQVLTAIRTVLNGEVFLSGKIAQLLVHRLAEKHTDNKAPSAVNDGISNLTRREMQVFQMMGAGMKPGAIAKLLKLSVKTVNTHRENIKIKLGCKDTYDLTHRAIKWVAEEKA